MVCLVMILSFGILLLVVVSIIMVLSNLSEMWDTIGQLLLAMLTTISNLCSASITPAKFLYLTEQFAQ